MTFNRRICVQSSIEIISLISTIVASTGLRRTWLGAWWFTLYYTFNAALVLFAALLVVQSQPSGSTGGIALLLSPAEMHRAMLEASAVLRRLDTENRTIKKCAEYVEKLIEIFRTLGMDNLLSSLFWIFQFAVFVFTPLWLTYLPLQQQHRTHSCLSRSV
jgi:hypothetical protein